MAAVATRTVELVAVSTRQVRSGDDDERGRQRQGRAGAEPSLEPGPLAGVGATGLERRASGAIGVMRAYSRADGAVADPRAPGRSGRTRAPQRGGRARGARARRPSSRRSSGAATRGTASRLPAVVPRPPQSAYMIASPAVRPNTNANRNSVMSSPPAPPRRGATDRCIGCRVAECAVTRLYDGGVGNNLAAELGPGALERLSTTAKTHAARSRVVPVDAADSALRRVGRCAADKPSRPPLVRFPARVHERLQVLRPWPRRG